jgi:hypothetical protein
MAESSVNAAVAALKRALPNGRVSQGVNQTFFGTDRSEAYGYTLNDSLDGSALTRLEAIEKVRHYALCDEDVSGAERDLQALVNPGWGISYLGASRQVARAKEVTELLQKRLYKHGGGLDGLVNNQTNELYETGISSCEWFPDRGREQLQDVAVVRPEEIVAKRNNEIVTFYQKPTTGFYQKVGQGIELNSLTYNYIALNPKGDSVYGEPIPRAALKVLKRKDDIDAGIARVIKLIGKGALVSVTVPKPTPSELGVTSEDDPNYIRELKLYMEEVADLVVQGQEEQLYFAYETEAGKPDIKVHTLAASASGMRELELGNLFRVWSGIGSTSFLRGYMESTTESLARTVWLMLSSLAKNLQPLLKAQIEFGLNLNLRLHGIAAQAVFTFDPVPNPFILQDIQADIARADADAKLLEQMGLDYLPTIYRYWGIVPGKSREELPKDMRSDLEPDVKTGKPPVGGNK